MTSTDPTYLMGLVLAGLSLEHPELGVDLKGDNAALTAVVTLPDGASVEITIAPVAEEAPPDPA